MTQYNKGLKSGINKKCLVCSKDIYVYPYGANQEVIINLNKIDFRI